MKSTNCRQKQKRSSLEVFGEGGARTGRRLRWPPGAKAPGLRGAAVMWADSDAIQAPSRRRAPYVARGCRGGTHSGEFRTGRRLRWPPGAKAPGLRGAVVMWADSDPIQAPSRRRAPYVARGCRGGTHSGEFRTGRRLPWNIRASFGRWFGGPEPVI